MAGDGWTRARARRGNCNLSGVARPACGGLLLLAGLFCRPAALVAWFLYLCSVKSGELFSYGVDNFTTIGLFYVLIAPLPDPFALDQKLRKKRMTDLERMGFHRRVLQLHLCVVYFFGASPSHWRRLVERQ